MLNLIRKFLRPTLREQLEAGVREALRRYADRHTAPNLRVYISTDLVAEGVDPALWARDEAEHLRRFALQWAEDNSIARAGLRLEIVLLDTKKEFAFVKPVGLEEKARPSAPMAASTPVGAAPGGAGAAVASGAVAVLDVVSSPSFEGSLQVNGELTVGRKTEQGVHGIGDRYMSSKHARLHVERGGLFVTDLDSKNRTFLNETALPPHQPQKAAVGDNIRMGTTTLRVTRVEG
ncbi:MAG: FHA domain-containing protein [Gemmatimonadetes bacterium]|nr:FHA domain-containing protein [Gemmatimonadota bacterium]